MAVCGLTLMMRDMREGPTLATAMAVGGLNLTMRDTREDPMLGTEVAVCGSTPTMWDTKEGPTLAMPRVMCGLIPTTSDTKEEPMLATLVQVAVPQRQLCCFSCPAGVTLSTPFPERASRIALRVSLKILLKSWPKGNSLLRTRRQRSKRFGRSFPALYR